jgi:hypothetical protein
MVFKERKKWNGVVVSTGVAIKGIRTNIHKGRRPLYLGEEDVKHTLLDCLETRNWTLKFLNIYWLSMNKETDIYRQSQV